MVNVRNIAARMLGFLRSAQPTNATGLVGCNNRRALHHWSISHGLTYATNGVMRWRLLHPTNFDFPDSLDSSAPAPRRSSPAPGRALRQALLQRRPASAAARARSARLQFSTTTTGVSRAGRRCASSFLAVTIASRPPMYWTSVSQSGRVTWSGSPGAVLEVKKATLRATPRLVSGCRAAAAAASAAVMPGTISTSMPACFERAQFFVGAAEQHRVAAFQAHDQRVLLRAVDQLLVDQRLRGRALAGALADRDQLGLRAQRQHLGRDQRVVQHDVGLRQQARAAHGDQVGGAGAGADQIDLAEGRLSPAMRPSRSSAPAGSCRRRPSGA